MISLVENKNLQPRGPKFLEANELLDCPWGPNHHLRHNRCPFRYMNGIPVQPHKALRCNPGVLPHPAEHLHVLNGQLPGGADTERLRRLHLWVDAAEHPKHETCSLAGAIVRLRDQVPVGRAQDHRQAYRLDLARLLKLHLHIEPLQKLRREAQVLEPRRRGVRRVARSNLNTIQNPNRSNMILLTWTQFKTLIIFNSKPYQHSIQNPSFQLKTLNNNNKEKRECERSVISESETHRLDIGIIGIIQEFGRVIFFIVDG